MKLLCKICALAIIVGCCTTSVQAQKKKKKGKADTSAITVDTSKTPRPKPISKGPKPYDEVITKKAKTDDGMFKVHTLEDKYFFEIPKTLLKKDILVVNRISKAPSSGRNSGLSYAGDAIGQKVI
ncbi:MAG: DUF5118 domain-containing protein, partial [Flavobacterium sp.]